MDNNYTIAEKVTLPSKGLIYSTPINPEITLRAMTTREEMKRLAPTDKPYKAMCDIIWDCIVGEKPKIHVYDMCMGDYIYLLHRIRTITYGSDYKLTARCPFCNSLKEYNFNLDELDIVEYEPDGKDLFKLTLPRSKTEIEIKLQTPRILDTISSEVKAFKKKFKGSIDPTLRITLQNIISKVNGEDVTPSDLEQFALQLSMGDVNYIINKSEKLNRKVGIDTSIILTCAECGDDFVSTFRYTSEFFGPTYDE